MFNNSFIENIRDNIIIFATFATGETINGKPRFLDNIEYKNFLNKDKKFWYNVDSMSIFYNELDKVTKYSFKELNNFYENEINNFNRNPFIIQNYSNFLIKREKYIIEINNLLTNFKDLIIEKYNLKEKENKINEICKIINGLEDRIKNINEKKIKEEEDKLNKIINREETKRIITFKEHNINKFIHCEICKENCYNKLYEYLFNINYPFLEKKCDKCGHEKNKHIQDNNYYTTKLIKNNKDKNILEENNDKLKENILEIKEKYLKEKENIEKKIKIINNQIIYIIIKIRNIYQKLMNIIYIFIDNYTYDENELIDILKNKLKEIGYNIDEINEIYEEIKLIYQIFEKEIIIPIDELINMDYTKFTENLNELF